MFYQTLDENSSNDSTLVFDSESIEIFVEGGQARFTIIIHGKKKTETVFDVAFPGREYTCFGKNILSKELD